MILFGGSGLGKTRTLFEVLSREASGGGSIEPIRWIRGIDFQTEVIERTKPNGSGGIVEWRESLVEAFLLAFDDLDKARFTPRVEVELFNLIDRRTNERRPIIITSNSSSDALLAKLSPDTGPAIVRRIREFCHPINFDPRVDSKEQIKSPPRYGVKK